MCIRDSASLARLIITCLREGRLYFIYKNNNMKSVPRTRIPGNYVECLVLKNTVFAKVRFYKFTTSKIVPKAMFAVNF